MTSRDRDIYTFIDMVGICTAKQIKDIFLPKVDITKTYQRLRVLVKEEFIKVSKIGLNNYYYVNSKTSKKMLEHDLKVTELVGFLKANGATILKFKRNKIIGRDLKDNIYADGYVIYKVKIGDKTYKKHILIEVQRTLQQKPDISYGKLYGCVNKYNHTSIKEGFEKLKTDYVFKHKPPLVVITDIEDTSTQLLTTQLIKLPYIKNESWDILIR